MTARLRPFAPYLWAVPVLAALAWTWAVRTPATAVIATGFTVAAYCAGLFAQGGEAARNRARLIAYEDELDVYDAMVDDLAAPSRSPEQRAAIRALVSHRYTYLSALDTAALEIDNDGERAA